ncbi:MAG: hypothetical protein HYU97_03480 [Deltaproteobacteria bacterium]|nr:hypothetical protein [Deltaproteobacteria bacterium]
MGQKMKWEDMVKNYPAEWVALIDYESKDALNIEGIVVAHDPDRNIFHHIVGDLLPKYGDMAIRYTGELVKNEEIPLLWQISHTD